jgi:hypothetical protein
MKRKSDILDLDLGKALNKYQQTSLSSVRGGGMRILFGFCFCGTLVRPVYVFRGDQGVLE